MTELPVPDFTSTSARDAPERRRIRVLMGIPAPGATGGGPALHLPMLVEDLRRRGDVDVVTMPYGRWQEAEPLPVKVWHQLVDGMRYPRRVRAADPDLVHLNTALDRKALIRDVTFVFLTRSLGKRVFLKWHGSETDLLRSGAPWWRALGRLLLRSVDALGLLSTREAEEVRALGRAPRCFVVKNCIDTSRYREKVDLHAELGLPRGAPLLLFIGRLIPTKGLEDTVRALPAVAVRHGTHLLVVGDGPSRRPAEELVRRLGLQAHVHFVGAKAESEALRFYNGADILVFPSYHAEGFPMVVFQSVVAGMGIVTTRLRAVLDHLREPDHCLLVAPHAPEEVARALDRLLGDPGLLERMRAYNRELAQRFDRTVVAAEFSRVYREIVSGAPAAAAEVAGPVLEG